ncbi:MBL fold metallo-hydrolase [Thiogranum longum]
MNDVLRRPPTIARKGGDPVRDAVRPVVEHHETARDRASPLRPVRLFRFAIVSVLLMTGTGRAADDCSGEGVTLQVLGSGGPEVYSGRAAASYIIRVGGEARVMVDAGPGSGFRFGQSGAKFDTIRALLFTHLHVDHSADFPFYIKSSFFSPRTDRLFVYGPAANRLMPATTEFVTASIGPAPSVYPYLSDYLEGGESYRVVPADVDIAGRELISVAEFDEIRLSAIPVHHGPVPALAWRVDIEDASIVFSGDMNGDYRTLPELAKGADILVAHNAVPEEATGVARNLHMPPSVIGDIARQARVGKLVLSHRMHRTLGREPETRELIAERYKGPVVFAEDLDCFNP